MKTKDIVEMGIMTTLLYVVKVLFEALPNLEGVTLLIVCGTMVFRWKMMSAVNAFLLLEAVQWGFGWWWVGYVIVWNLLVMLTILFSESLKDKVIRCVFMGMFGICFGGMFAITYIPVSVDFAIIYWISGLWFDIVHCIGNFIVGVVFSERLIDVLRRVNKAYRKDD